ncbi:MAG: phosphoglycerate mutase [Rhodospirillaceae bacterium]|jgi:broad specificity phosphatase PhoE|nr:phosphoglycerate mutase [Rhodospirillaceae bacterium]MDP6304893.1 histidine phosphatase family protein [Alphaproteobacteria bacterium]MDP7468790.1 histidine phosphatase family protein [Alphaproteobacteria bacterium]MDP7543044.1 histidine phosphatase family protein [Alphaproteobacteria bacterium]MDP7669796.1 histidine phosphatase family protein [Alphaproteobacteria bacterium]
MTKDVPRITRWWWLRHAPVPERRGRVFGQMDVDADISDVAILNSLASCLPRDALWVTSPLKRASQTAAALAKAVGHDAEPLVEPDFAEQDFGLWQGLTHNEMAERFPMENELFWKTPGSASPPGGESFVQVMERVGRAIAALSRDHLHEERIVFAHGGVIRAALAAALGCGPERALCFAVDNLSVTRIDRMILPGEAVQWRVSGVNLVPV